MAHANLLPKSVWQRLHPDPAFTFQVEGGTVHYASQPNDDIGNELFWTGGFESETSSVFVKLARGARTILDVGANTGYFTLLSCTAAPQAAVIAFEPIPAIYELLCNNVARNGWQARCTLRREAVSNMQGVTAFHVPYSGSIPTSGSLSVHGFRGYEGELIDTPVTTLDAVCATLDTVNLAKIDVEGFEDKVLEGMPETLRRCHPDIIVECNHDGPYQRVEEILAAFGYSFYALRGSGPVAVDHLLPDAEDKHRNFLCSTDRFVLGKLQ
jgi:FkbM family methyltransferase